jgi:uncharacterized protein (DUF433 family)
MRVRGEQARMSGVSVEIIVSRFRGGETLESIAEDYELSFNEVCEAIRCGAR